jgi:hypothetical protein
MFGATLRAHTGCATAHCGACRGDLAARSAFDVAIADSALDEDVDARVGDPLRPYAFTVPACCASRTAAG